MDPLSTSALKIKPIHKEKIKFPKLINYHKLTLISAGNNIGDCCSVSSVTAYFNKQRSFSKSNAKDLNKFKYSISNLVSPGKTMLEGNKHNN